MCIFMPMDSTDPLAKLNPEQRTAVTTTEGAVLVLSGPGTGKTHMLTDRIVHLLRTVDANPENILCLTFTQSGARQMQTRLADPQKLGRAALNVHIHTFHGFAQWVAERFPESFTQGAESADIRVMDDLEQALLFEAVHKSRKWDYLHSYHNPFFWKGPVLRAISDFKREGLTPEDLRAALGKEHEVLMADPANFYKKKTATYEAGDIKPAAELRIEKTIGKFVEIADFWELYEAEKIAQQLQDFDDQILRLLQALSANPDLKSELQEQFQYVLVDEYQDTNSAQNRILWHLTDFFENPNLFCVGDDDQAIYRFQGASVENIRTFEARFPAAHRIMLHRNYRSAQGILRLASSLITHNADRFLEKPALTAEGENAAWEGKTSMQVFATRLQELQHIKAVVLQSKESGTPGEEIAVIARENKEVKEIADFLQGAGIPVTARLKTDVFADHKIKLLLQMYRLFDDPTRDDLWYEVLYAPLWDIPGGALMRLSLAKKEDDKAKIPFAKTLEAAAKDDETLAKVWNFFVDFHARYHRASPESALGGLFHQSGLATYLGTKENPSRMSDMMNMQTLLKWTRDQPEETRTHAGILQRIDLHQKLGITLETDPLPGTKDAVQVMTAHGSKGQEFDTVLVPGMTDGVWGNKRKPSLIPTLHLLHSDHDPEEDERRLCFVALTRARKQLYLSYAQKDAREREKAPCAFWLELEETSVTPVQGAENSPPLSEAELLAFFTPKDDLPPLSEDQRSILLERVKDFVWSPHSLQNYLDCPRKFLFLNVLQVPDKPSPPVAVYGKAVHSALETFIKSCKQGTVPDGDTFWSFFEASVRSHLVTAEEAEPILDQGRRYLPGFFDAKLRGGLPGGEVEFDFSATLGDIKVRGRADHITFAPDGHSATIIDYKSGRPRALTPGTPYWRQMVFYDLMAHASPGISWVAESLQVHYLTPDDAGKYALREIQPSDENRQILREEIRECHEKINRLEFPILPNPEGDAEIEYWQSFGRLPLG